MRHVHNQRCEEKLLAAVGHYESNDDRFALAETCFELGHYYQEMGDLQRATAQYRRSLVVCEALGARRESARAYRHLGLVFEMHGDMDQARFYLNEALEISQRIEDALGIARAEGALAFMELAAGNIEEAERGFSAALTIAEEEKDVELQAEMCANLAQVELSDGRTEAAADFHREALRLYRGIGDERGVAGQYRCLGVLALQNGDREEAKSHIDRARSMHERADWALGLGLVCESEAEWLRVGGEWSAAAEMCWQALGHFERAGHQGKVASVRVTLARYRTHEDNFTDACQLLEQALEHYEEVDDRVAIARTCKKLGDIYWRQTAGEMDRVERMYRRALDVFQLVGDERGSGAAYVGLGKAAVKRGETTQAVAMWSAASELLRKSGCDEEVEQLQGAIRQIWSGGIQVA